MLVRLSGEEYYAWLQKQNQRSPTPGVDADSKASRA